jgi:hypothetical protein
MGGRLRSAAVAAAVVLALLIPGVAAGDEFAACWVTTEWNSASLQWDQVTRCRIAGGNITDYASDSDVPSVLYPNLGSDATGGCWYLTSVPTPYLIINQFGDGSVELGYDSDPSNPGGIITVEPNIRRCTSEPVPDSDPATDAWDYVMSYIHRPPTPDLNPEPGQGVTGLDTYLGMTVPEDHQGTLISGGSTVEVEIEVDAVIVDWGDGDISTYPPDSRILAGYPDGSATHIYEVKNPDGASVVVEYDWTARWRISGGDWNALDVPNTETFITYPIAEVISRLDE